MKNFRLIFGISLLLIAGCDSTIKTSEINKELMLTLDNYFDGRREADIGKLSQAFAENARLQTVDAEGKELDISREQYFNVVKKKGEVAVKTQIMYLSITGNIAMAQTRFDYGSKIYLDYLTLIKTQKGWRIINKAFTKIETQ